MTSALVAYIASPVAIYFTKNLSDEEFIESCKKAKSHALQVSLAAKEKGYIPLSVPILFLDIYDERAERDRALRDCFEILERCDVFFYQKNDLPKSEGMQKELKYAMDRGMLIVEV